MPPIPNLLTGIWFFFGFPEQYFHRPSFRLLLDFVGTAAINVAMFYLADAFREVKLMQAAPTHPCPPSSSPQRHGLLGSQ